MTMAQSLVLFVIAAGLLTLTPGLDTALVLRTSASEGARPATFVALGIGLGCLTWGVAAASGLTALLAAAPMAFEVLKLAGTVYLVWLGARLAFSRGGGLDIVASVQNVAPQRDNLQRDAGGKLLRTFPHPALLSLHPALLSLRRGLFCNLLNPKVGVFYISFLPQFVPAGAPVGGYMLLLACLHVALGLIWSTVLIGATLPLGRLLRRPGVVRSIDRLTGCVLIGFGLKLALSRR